MSNKLLMVLLFFCGFLVVTSMPAFATIIDTNYLWYTSGGTVEEPWYWYTTNDNGTINETQGMLYGPNLEPSSMLLLGIGVLGLFGLGRKKAKA